MASSKAKRRGKIMGRHSSKLAGENADKPCNETSFVKGGCGVSVCTSPDLNASHKMELMIGDMTISIDADLPSPSFGTSQSYNKSGAAEAQDRENRAAEVECRPSFTQLGNKDIDLRHNFTDASTSGCSSCPLCLKDLVTEISSTCGTYETETCKHLFCKECFGNLVKGCLLRLSLKSATLEDITSALQCPVPECEQHFTYRDIQQAVGSTALQQFQNVLVSLFSRNFGSSWEKVCPQCSTKDVRVSLISATDLEYLGLAEVYRAMETRGLSVSGRSKEQGLRNLETVTSALVASPWRLVCLTCDFVQCETCGLQVQGPRSTSLVKRFSPDGTIEDFGIILQGREISPYPNTPMPDPILDREREPPFLGTPTTSDITHKECDTCRKQCFSVYSAAMEINACNEGCVPVANSLQELFEKCTSKSRSDIKEAAIWPVDGNMVDAQHQPGGSLLDLSQKLQTIQAVPCLPYDPLNMATSNGVSQNLVAGGEDSLNLNASVVNMLKVLLPTEKRVCLSQVGPLERELKSSILELPPQKPGFGAHRQLMMIPTTENLHFNVPIKDPHVLMNNGSMLKGGANSNKYWSSKAETWMRSSDYWCQESERFALASDWWVKECNKWAGRSDEMAHKANIWANLEAHWTQSTERVMAANKLWGYKIQEMSELCTSVLQTGTNGAFYSELGPRLERVGSFSTNPPQLQILNLRTRSDVDEYSDCMGAETEWISPVEGDNECWSTASNASVPLTSLNSSPTTSDSPIHSKEQTRTCAGSFGESKVTAVGKIADEKLINSFWDLSNTLEVIAALGANLSAPAAYFLWGFEPLREILLSLLRNNSLPDIMTRESLYSETFFLLRAISSHKNILPILFMPNSRLISVTTPQCGNEGSVFEAFEKLHLQAEDMLSEALVTVENDHDATQKNVNLIGDMEDAYDIVQGSLESSWKPGQALPS